VEGLKGIIKILKDSFYRCYRAFGLYDERTQHEYDLWKDTAIGAMEEKGGMKHGL